MSRLPLLGVSDLSEGLQADGAAKVGYTAPSVEGQARVIAMAHAFGQIDPDTIGYIEAPALRKRT